jgi:thermitase
MIVKRIKAQIAFGVIVVGFTCLMAYIQIHNLSQEIVADPVKPPALPEEVVAEPVTVVEVVPEPEPEPEPEPFVMKEVGGKDAIDGEYLISFFDEKDRKEFADLVAGAGGEVLFLSEYGNVIKVKLKDAAQLEDLLRSGPLPLDYSANYNVYYPERPVSEPLKPDRYYGLFGEKALIWLGLRNDHKKWGKGIKVAVLDNGVRPHPAFTKSISQIDLVGPTPDASDSAGHGTAVASLIVGWHPELMGVAPSAELLSICVVGADGRGNVLDAARGIMKALESDAKVINVSLGTYGDSFVLRQAVEEAQKRGVAIVASVGNDGTEGVTFPAGYDGVVGVSAVDALGQNLYFGNTGDGVDVSAPGYGVKAAWIKEGFLDDFSGTSAAAPYVSGTIAALMARGLEADEAIERVLSLADDAGDPGRDPEYGEGILNIRRIEEHGEKGIRDAAISCLLLKEGGVVVVGMQNRGTESLAGARVNIKSGTRLLNFDIGRTQPGQTVSKSFKVQEGDYARDGKLTVYAEIPLAGLQDAYPGNNARRMVVQDRQRADR